MGNGCYACYRRRKQVSTIDTDLIQVQSHYIIAGTPSSGKSVLWTRLVYPSIPLDDVIKNMISTISPQVSVLSSNHEVAVWDLPSNMVVQQQVIRSFSHMMIDLLVFVVPLNLTEELYGDVKKYLNELIGVADRIVLYIAAESRHYDEDGDLTADANSSVIKIIANLNLNQYESKKITKFNWVVMTVSDDISKLFS